MKKKNGPGLIYNEQMSTSSCRHLSQSMHVPVNQWTNSGFNIKIIEDSIFSEEQKIMREILGQITNLQSFLLNTPSCASQVGGIGPWDCACCLFMGTYCCWGLLQLNFCKVILFLCRKSQFRSKLLAEKNSKAQNKKLAQLIISIIWYGIKLS